MVCRNTSIGRRLDELIVAVLNDLRDLVTICLRELDLPDAAAVTLRCTNGLTRARVRLVATDHRFLGDVVRPVAGDLAAVARTVQGLNDQRVIPVAQAVHAAAREAGELLAHIETGKR